MDLQLKQRWINALRSGLYKQTQGVLWAKEPHKFQSLDCSRGNCCLGVLLDVYDSNNWEPGNTPTYKVELDNSEWYEDGCDISDGELSGPMLNMVGLTESQQSALIKLNDIDKCSFDQIADWIEENL